MSENGKRVIDQIHVNDEKFGVTITLTADAILKIVREQLRKGKVALPVGERLGTAIELCEAEDGTPFMWFTDETTSLNGVFVPENSLHGTAFDAAGMTKEEIKQRIREIVESRRK